MSLLVGQVNFFQDKPIGLPRVRGICNRYTYGYGKLVYRFQIFFYLCPKNRKKPMKYYVIAGEASGDLHASNLIKGLRKFDSGAEFAGGEVI